ncbi:MAG TPA: tetratricopeptide repeat protein [Bacteroidales bacterium]|nr:tetratricopeptide repeat protein [Bacteroidales bacterium]HPB20131.1 tetratricopeptide repeat protein [Bacteroidales bacterium]
MSNTSKNKIHSINKNKVNNKKITSNKSINISTSKNQLLDKPLYIYLLLFISCLLVYFNSFQNELIYNWDDAGYILKNPYIDSLSWQNIKDIFSNFYFSNYQPLTLIVYAVIFKFVGTKVFLYHFVQFIFHVLNTFLVYKFISLLQNKKWISIGVALLFAVHPMHVESVAWISEMKDVLYTFFFLLALITYHYYVNKPDKKTKWYLWTIFLFILSLLSKPSAVIFSVVLLAMDLYYERLWRWRTWIEKIPFFLLSLGFGIITILAQEGAIQELGPVLKGYERALIVIYSYILYLWKFFLPINLSAAYPYPIKDGGVLPTEYFIIPIAFIALCVIVYLLRKNKKFIWGILFFTINLLMVIQIIPVGGMIASERYTYIPYIGLSFSALTLMEKYIKNIKLNYVILGIIVVIFTFLAHQRTYYWRNGDVLFSDVLNKYPRYAYGYNNRGFLYWDHYAIDIYKDNPQMKEKYVEKALQDFTKAINLDYTYAEPFLNRGILYYNTGRPDQALADFNRFLELKPDNPDGLLNRANTLSTLGRFKEAIPDYNKYLTIKNDDPKAYMWRGIAYFNIQNYDSAIIDFNKSIEIDPDYYEPYYWLGVIYYNQKDYSNALKYLDLSISKNSNNANSYIWKGLCYMNMNEYHKAIEQYSKAIEIDPNNSTAYINRFNAYRLIGDIANAQKDFEILQKFQQ